MWCALVPLLKHIIPNLPPAGEVSIHPNGCSNPDISVPELLAPFNLVLFPLSGVSGVSVRQPWVNTNSHKHRTLAAPSLFYLSLSKNTSFPMKLSLSSPVHHDSTLFFHLYVQLSPDSHTFLLTGLHCYVLGCPWRWWHNKGGSRDSPWKFALKRGSGRCSEEALFTDAVCWATAAKSRPRSGVCS